MVCLTSSLGQFVSELRGFSTCRRSLGSVVRWTPKQDGPGTRVCFVFFFLSNWRVERQTRSGRIDALREDEPSMSSSAGRGVRHGCGGSRFPKASGSWNGGLEHVRGALEASFFGDLSRNRPFGSHEGANTCQQNQEYCRYIKSKLSVSFSWSLRAVFGSSDVGQPAAHDSPGEVCVVLHRFGWRVRGAVEGRSSAGRAPKSREQFGFRSLFKNKRPGG